MQKSEKICGNRISLTKPHLEHDVAGRDVEDEHGHARGVALVGALPSEAGSAKRSTKRVNHFRPYWNTVLFSFCARFSLLSLNF